MTTTEARELIRGLASVGRYRFTTHAMDRMQERGVLPLDVRNALANARTCADQGGGKWKTDGPNLDGDALTCVVVLDDGILVVTVF